MHMNQQAKDVFGDQYVKPIEEECMVTEYEDPFTTQLTQLTF